MKRPAFLPLLTVIAFVLSTAGHLGAQSLQVIRYSENEGLTNTLVKSVAIGSDGLIWVGTDGGLFFFDGWEFSHYESPLPSPYVKSVFCRKNGDVEVTTDMGALLFPNGRRNAAPRLLRNGSVRPVDSLLWFPKSCYEDRSGKLWFGDNRRIYCFEKGSIRSYFPGEEALTNNFQRSYSFAEDSYGHLYTFAEPGRIYRYDPAGDRFVPITLPVPLSNIQAALAADSRTILVATRSGLVEFTPAPDGSCASLTAIKGSPEISCLFRHAPGRFYAGTWADGLYEVRAVKPGYRISKLEEVREKNINNISGGPEGTVWIASDNGLLLLQHNLFTAPFSTSTRGYIQSVAGDSLGNTYFCDGQRVFCSAPESEPYPSPAIQTVKTSATTLLQALPAEGGMWFSDVNARIWFEKPVGTPVRKFDFSGTGRAVFSLKRDSFGNIWACQDQNPSLIRITPAMEVKFYGQAQGITSRPLVAAIGPGGRIVAGAMADSAYLFGYEPSRDRFVNLSRPFRFEHNIDININDMAFGPDSTLWLGSSFGLLLYRNGEIHRAEFGEMTGSSVKAVAVDRNGNIWLGNSLGLHMYTNGQLLSFDDRTGILSKIITYRCLHIDAAGRLWVGTVEGVMVSSPLPMPRKTVAPFIADLLINDQKQVDATKSGFSFNDRSFATLTVGVLDYPYVNFRIEMRLAGRDSAWQPVPRSGHIILANLEPGKYTLELRASKTGNFLPSDTLRCGITVTRIWYTRPWFILLTGLAALLLFWLGLRLKTMSLKRYNEKLEKAILERTRETMEQKDRIEAQNISILHVNEELRQANIGLEKARIIAEEASDAQRKFLSVMSHELRTPLNAVIGAAHLLVRKNPRPDQSEDLQVLRFSAENLLGLINNILDFTKIDSGKVALEQIPFNLRNLVEEIVSAMKIRAREKEIDLGFSVGEGIPEQLIGDPLRLAQIINNLVGNALKFTERGSINIELILREKNPQEATIDFIICDTGIGMSAETLSSIFEIFVQGSSETTRKYGGTGLGLVITRKLLELHGSDIKAQSTPGVGTCFSFSIRFTLPDSLDPEAGVSRVNYRFSPFTGKRVLLVEDNHVNKLIAGKFLKDWELEVETADNGAIAVDLVTSRPYDLVLMDIQMPEMDGYQASAAIRALGGAFAVLPIIALTAATQSDVSDLIFGSGMNDFISKPFNPVDLHMKIRKHLG